MMINMRDAREEDIPFFIKGLEETRTIEKRPKKDIKSCEEDVMEFKKGIKNRTIRVAQSDGETIGFLFYKENFKVNYVNERFIWIDLLFVKKRYRRKGVGMLLYEDLFRIAREKGYKMVVNDVFSANVGSRAFHKKLGFRPVYTIYRKEL